MVEYVKAAQECDIAVIIVDNPPVSAGVPEAISGAIQRAEGDHPAIHGFGSLRVETASQDVEAQTPWKQVLTSPADAKKLRLLFLGSGQDEAGLLTPGKKLASLLKDKGVRVEWADHPGGQVFSVWRHHLNESVPMLFRK